MHIKSRLFLIALLVATQAACLGFGVAWATGWLWQAFETVVHNYVSAEGHARAQQLVYEAEKLGLDSLEPGSPEWRRLQDLCENAEIAHEGFACVIRREDGAMLCHPNMENDPNLLSLYPGRAFLLNETGAAPIISLFPENDSKPSPVVTGKVDLNGELHVFTGFPLAGVDAILAVYQSDMAIDEFIASTIRPVMQVGYALTAFIVGATGFITVFLINRYEANLSKLNERLEWQVEQRTRSLVRTRNAVIFGLAKLAESRDKDTGAHLERIRSYTTVLASEMAKTNPEIDRSFLADLAIASSLHDIGKVGIPDTVLLKAGKLTECERRAMKLHTVLGSECLAAIRKQLGDDDFLELAEQIAASHHEQWNGSGYPKGLKGEEIPLVARIVALADVYDALTTSRPYKGPISHEETRDWIAGRSGEQFDPAVVEAFLAREEDFLAINVQSIERTHDQVEFDHLDAELEESANAEFSTTR